MLATLSMPVAAASMFEEFQAVRTQATPRTTLLIDNDSLLLNRDDGLYTSGVILEQHFSMREANGALAYGWRLGQFLYSASDIGLKPEQLGPSERPYAAWLFIGAYRETSTNDGASLRYGVDLGCIGPCAGGEWTQTSLHRLLHQPRPQGWASQVRNEAGVILNANAVPLSWRFGSNLDLALNLHGRFGNIFTDAGAGLAARFGLWNLDLGGNRSSLNGFLRADLKAVAYNATLQGAYFSSGNPHTVTPKRLVGEAELGVQWRYGAYGLRASIVRRGNEISGLANDIGTQNFVRLVFSHAP